VIRLELNGHFRVPSAVRRLLTANRLTRTALAGLGLCVGASGFAAEATLVSVAHGFDRTLSPEETAGVGLGQLSPAQIAALDRFVQRDIGLARDGDVGGFSRNFSQRLTPRERVAAGLARLRPEQVARLDGYVARAIATPPPPEAEFAYQPKLAPPPLAPLGASAAAAASPASLPMKQQGLIVHGDVSFTVGGGSGGSFYGTGLDVILSDPKGQYTIALGFSTFHGSGRYYPYPLLSRGPCLAPDSPFGAEPYFTPNPLFGANPLLTANPPGN
jgi:hypothetical protein